MTAYNKSFILQPSFLFIFMCVFAGYMVCPVAGETHRSLNPLGSLLSDCTSCQAFTDCQFSDDKCETHSSGELMNDVFDQNTEYIYCKNAVNVGTIRLEGNGPLELSHEKSANSTSHSLCQWELYNHHDSDLYIEIIRDVQIFESIRIYYTTSTASYTYEPRNLVNGYSNSTRINIGNAQYIRIKTQILNDNSDYIITVGGFGQSTDFAKGVLKIITIVSLIVLFIIILGVSIRIFFHCFISRRRRIMNQPGNTDPKRLRYIKTVIENMQKGTFSDLNLAYEQKSCVICIEDFSDQSSIIITNECSHVFHSLGLNEWFENMRIGNQIKCPLCSTGITEKSKPITKIHSNPQNISSSILEREEAQVMLPSPIEQNSSLPPLYTIRA